MKTALFALAVLVPLLAQERVDETTDAMVRSEEMEHSQIMHTLHMLTDRFGPRVTGTPNHELAARWAAEQMTQWGLKNAHLERWEFGHPGWLNEYANGHIIAPVRENVKFEVLAWTPSTPGKVVASAIQIVPPQGPLPPADPAPGACRGGASPRWGPLKTELDSWIAGTQDRVRGKIVLIGKAAVVPVDFEPPLSAFPTTRQKPV
jgi:hypothetical protein